MPDNIDPVIDPLKAYTEACNTFRHYSNASLQVRLASVAQGIVLLGAWALAVLHKSQHIEIFVPISGLFFTGLLYRFHMGYYRATESFFKAAAKMESKFFDEDCRPVTGYNQEYEMRFGSRKEKILTLNAPFTFVGAMFLLALIISAIRLISQA